MWCELSLLEPQLKNVEVILDLNHELWFNSADYTYDNQSIHTQ